MKTIKQIADELGVSKQAVFKKIKKEPLSTSLQGLTTTVDGRLTVSIDGEKLIKQAFLEIYRQPLSSTYRQPVDGKVYSVLQDAIENLERQLAIKDKQIEETNERLKEVTAALLESQRTTHAAQTLHAADTMQLSAADQAEAQQPDVTDSEKKKKSTWWPWNR